MLAKNEEELENKFSIRKLSIGATAVLLGFTFWTTGQTAKADTIAPDSQTKNSKNGGVTKTGPTKLRTYSGLSAFLKAQNDAQTQIKPVKASAEKPVSNNSSNVAAEKPISAKGDNAAAEGKGTPDSDPSQIDPSGPAIDPNLPTVYKGKWNNVDASYNIRTQEVTLFGGTDAAPAIMKPAEGDDMLETLASFLGFISGQYESVETITIKGKIKVYGNANRLFGDIIELRKIDGLENLDTSEVTNMGFMFANLQWVTQLDVSHFNTSKVTFMAGMFSGCRSLLSLDMSHFDTSKVMFMAEMFSGCESLTSLDLSSFNTASVPVDGDDTSLTMDGIFNCGNLQILTLGKKFKFKGTVAFNRCPGKWINWGMTNKKLRKGTHQWSSEEFFGKYNNVTDYDTYVRLTNLAAPITIQYRNLQGKKFSDVDDDIEFGNVDDSLINAKNPDSILSFKYKSIPGYGFDHAQVGKEKIDLKKIKYTKTPQTITLYYFQYPSSPLVRASVTVHYKDEFGNALAPDKVLNGYAGNSYVTDPAIINDYTLMAKPANSAGLFKNDPQNVTYVYALNQSVPKETPIKRKHHHVGKKQHQSKNRQTINRATGLNAGAKKPQTLPQTGSNKRANLVALGLGSLAIIGVLGISYLSHKKRD